MAGLILGGGLFFTIVGTVNAAQQGFGVMSVLTLLGGCMLMGMACIRLIDPNG